MMRKVHAGKADGSTWLNLVGPHRGSFMRAVGLHAVPLLRADVEVIEGGEYGQMRVVTIDPSRLTAYTKLKLAAWIAEGTGNTLAAMIADVESGKARIQVGPDDEIFSSETVAWG